MTCCYRLGITILLFVERVFTTTFKVIYNGRLYSLLAVVLSAKKKKKYVRVVKVEFFLIFYEARNLLYISIYDFNTNEIEPVIDFVTLAYFSKKKSTKLNETRTSVFLL